MLNHLYVWVVQPVTHTITINKGLAIFHIKINARESGRERGGRQEGTVRQKVTQTENKTKKERGEWERQCHYPFYFINTDNGSNTCFLNYYALLEAVFIQQLYKLLTCLAERIWRIKPRLASTRAGTTDLVTNIVMWTVPARIHAAQAIWTVWASWWWEKHHTTDYSHDLTATPK